MTAAVFEMATRNKWRFPYKGLISVEDLWDLPMEELDKVFKSLNAQAKVAGEESLLATKTTEDSILDAKILLVRYIADVKARESQARVQAAEKRAKREKLLAALAHKQDEAINNASEEELLKMLKELDD